MMKVIKIGFMLSVLSLILLSCKTVAQKSNIISISYSHTAGRGGSMSMTATKDSIEFSSFGRNFESTPNLKKKIDVKDWDQLVSGINLSVLEKTQSGKRQGIFDGPDAIFRVVTTEKEYELFNVPEDSEGYKQLNKIRTTLTNLTPKYKN